MGEEHPAIALLREFLDIPSPPGREEKTASLVRGKLDILGLAHETDAAGNVLVRLPGRKPDAGTVIYAAHMDEIGMVVTRVEPDGTLRVDRSGGLYPWKLGEGPVDILGDFEILPGILSMGSIHTRRVRDRVITWDHAWIITGLSPERLEEAGVRCGSSAVPARAVRGPVFLGEGEDPLVGAWTFDDRIDVINLLLLLERLKKAEVRPVRPTVVAFTVHEEAGCHGAKVLAHREKPELFVALDGCPVLPELDLELDGRPGIWSKDALTHFDQEVVLAFRRAAREVGTMMMPAVYDGAASDASHVYACGGAPRVATVGHIRDNSHGFEVARLSSIENILRVVVRFVETWDG
ncbi:MAG: M20/M25/M40 family metallo-hydrolase [Planctomycetota bacterium]|jgi:putative aminopeptidase FrvX